MSHQKVRCSLIPVFHKFLLQYLTHLGGLGVLPSPAHLGVLPALAHLEDLEALLLIQRYLSGFVSLDQQRFCQKFPERSVRANHPVYSISLQWRSISLQMAVHSDLVVPLPPREEPRSLQQIKLLKSLSFSFSYPFKKLLINLAFGTLVESFHPLLCGQNRNAARSWGKNIKISSFNVHFSCLNGDF